MPKTCLTVKHLDKVIFLKAKRDNMSRELSVSIQSLFMKSIEELRKLYENQLKLNLVSLENQRKSLKNKYIFYGLGIVLSFLIVFFLSKQNSIFIYIGIAGIITFIILFLLLKKAKNLYRHDFKTNVVKEIVHLINPEWGYEPNGRILESTYRNSHLFPTHYDRYNGDDLVNGVIEKTDFRFSELHTEYKTVTTDKDGKRTEQWHTIFKGLFAHADFNKEIKGETLVLPDTAEKLFGSFGKKLQSVSGRGKLIKLENIEFEKQFVVYGSDQIEARYILTPTMMEAMVRVNKKYKKDIHFAFSGSRVYMAMSFNKDLFEPRVFKSGVRFEDMKQMNEQFGIIQTIIHEMNLNTRIWTKD